jgi:hypothetical protein
MTAASNGTEGGLVTARIASPRRIRNSAAMNIDAVIDTIRTRRIRIERWWSTTDGHLNICTPLLVSLRGAFNPAREYAG